MNRVSRTGDRTYCGPHQERGVLTGSLPQVTVNGRPILRMMDPGVYTSGCPDSVTPIRVIEGAATVRAGGRPIAAVFCKTSHPHSPGLVVSGSFDVMVGGPTVNVVERARANGIAQIDKSLAALDRWNEEDRANFRRWFGEDSEEARALIRERLQRMRERAEEVEFKHGNDDEDYGHVYPSKVKEVYLNDRFFQKEDEQAGTVVHELSHFKDTGHTADVEADVCDPKQTGNRKCYGRGDAKRLAKESPKDAQNNAANVEYFAMNS